MENPRVVSSILSPGTIKVRLAFNVGLILKNKGLTHGTLHIRINDVSFFYKMIGWIDGLKGYF